MALSLLKQVFRTPGRCLKNLPVGSPRFYSLYEPDYLNEIKPKVPLYPTLNFQITGYAYPILEKYQQLLCRLASEMNFQVENSYAQPPKELKVQKFKKLSSVLESEYQLYVYERNTQISEISSTQYAIFLRILEATLPEGVTLNVNVWVPAMEEKRYIPDKRLLNLKSELEK